MDSGTSRPNRTIIVLTLLIQAALLVGLVLFLVRRPFRRRAVARHQR